ncbi:hypothetical protein D3C78_1287830 [compost metagenome]
MPKRAHLADDRFAGCRSVVDGDRNRHQRLARCQRLRLSRGLEWGTTHWTFSVSDNDMKEEGRQRRPSRGGLPLFAGVKFLLRFQFGFDTQAVLAVVDHKLLLLAFKQIKRLVVLIPQENILELYLKC